jgi:hypothetical protein
MSYGNFSVILMVIIVAICGVGGAFAAMYFLNRAVREPKDIAKSAAANAEIKGG